VRVAAGDWSFDGIGIGFWSRPAGALGEMWRMFCQTKENRMGVIYEPPVSYPPRTEDEIRDTEVAAAREAIEKYEVDLAAWTEEVSGLRAELEALELGIIGQRAGLRDRINQKLHAIDVLTVTIAGHQAVVTSD
jgi:hypothetical protein